MHITTVADTFTVTVFAFIIIATTTVIFVVFVIICIITVTVVIRFTHLMWLQLCTLHQHTHTHVAFVECYSRWHMCIVSHRAHGCLTLNSKMFVGGLNWDTTEGSYCASGVV